MSEGAKLPDRCVKCDEPAEGFTLKRSLSWHPSGYYLLILLHILIYVIVALIVRKKATVFVPLCDRHRRARVRGIITAWVLGLGGLATMFLVPTTAESWVGPGQSGAVGAIGAIVGLILLLVGLIYGLVAGRVVVTKKIENGYVWLAKVDRGFLAALPPTTKAPDWDSL